MLVEEQLDKLVDLYKEADEVSVAVNAEICDTDCTIIWVDEDVLHIEFMDDDIKDLIIPAAEIEAVAFDEFGTMKIATISLDSGDTILVHTF